MWPCWRLVERRVASLEQLRSTWSLVDVDEANEMLDAIDEAKARQNAAPKK